MFLFFPYFLWGQFNAICCWRKPGSAKVGTLGLSRMLRVRYSSFTDGDAGEVGKAEVRGGGVGGGGGRRERYTGGEGREMEEVYV